MVRTRRQESSLSEERERMARLQLPSPTALGAPAAAAAVAAAQEEEEPGTTCSTPLRMGGGLAGGPQRKKSRLMFSPNPPVEHEFMLSSPPARRLPRLKGAPKQLDEARIRLEMEERGVSTPQKIGTDERRKAEEMWKTDLVKELKDFHGVDAEQGETHDDLVEMLELARTLRRRAELRTFFHILPSEMPLIKLQAELMSRRVNVLGLNHARASAALENALIKEDLTGLVGDGYQFGRKVVSVHDLLAIENPSDKHLRDILRAKSVERIPTKKADKLEMVRRMVESEKESELRKLIEAELNREMQRRGLANASMGGGEDGAPVQPPPGFSTPPDQQRGGRRRSFTTTNMESFTSKFQTLFRARVWREDYADVSNESLPESLLRAPLEGITPTAIPTLSPGGTAVGLDQGRCCLS